uniref:hypothetical protein n=1 Tax=Paenibacillus chitinolyticus TaxID=79263 RepID=UPI0036705D0F
PHTEAHTVVGTPPGAPVADVRVTAPDGTRVRLRERLGQGRLLLVLVGCLRTFSGIQRALARNPGVHPREESHPVVAMRSIAAATGAERTQETGPQRPARNVRCSNAGTSGGR